MPCVLHHEGRRHTGLVHDLSAGGLFVLTSASPRPGEVLDVELSLPGVKDPIRLQGRVARRRTVPARLRSLAQGGVGLQITGAPEAYFVYVASLLPQSEPSPPRAEAPRRKTTSLEKRARKLALRRALGPRPAPAPPEPEPDKPDPPTTRQRYQVKVKRGPRFLTLTVEAESEEQAREQALREVGEGWRVLRCAPV